MAAKADEKDSYWFIHNAGGEDRTFCFECGEKRRLELIVENKDNPKELDHLGSLDGGFSQESDSCVHCETCGHILSYSLTNYGAESEWDHFLTNGVHIDSPDVGYHILAILDHGMRLKGISKLKLK